MKKIISILTLSAVGIIGVAISNISSNALALGYSDNVGVNFTFDQSLTVSLSSADIVINSLAPGSSADSNIITVNVLSNNAGGYELKSTVGNATYANRDLNHTDDDAIFSSIDYGSSLESLTGDNTWGYSYSTDNNSWSNYSGLPKYNDTTNVATLRTSTSPSSETGDNTYFKIAAKASTTQPSGEYRNVVNFTVTAEHNPVSFYDAFKEAATKDPTITTLNGYYKMQDMTADICNTIEAEESQMTLIDTRDHNVYTVAKLKDNRCWMTTNLDLPGGTALYSETSNVPADYPESEGIPYYTLPESSPHGFNVNDNTKAFFAYNSGNDVASSCAEAPGCYSYYSWLVATAGSGASIIDVNVDAPYSICPGGWYLPSTRSGVDSSSDFRALAIAYGGSASIWKYNASTDPTGVAIRNKLDTGSVPNYYPAGYYNGSGYSSGSDVDNGHYWSSTSSSSNGAYNPYFNLVVFTFDNSNGRGMGASVRCIANNE